MELKEALLKRRSVRKFTEEKVNDEDINYLMHAAMSGPSACNNCPWEFYVIENNEVLDKLHQVGKSTNYNAPLAIVVVGNKTRFLPRAAADYWIQDTSAATENILLAAVDRNLGTVWCGVTPQDDKVVKLKEVLNLNEDQIPLNIIYVGHPLEIPEARDQYKEEYIHIIK